MQGSSHSRLASSSVGPLLGLRQNLAQFMLLVAVNALVGGTLGQERTVLPLLASQEFHLDLYTGALTYILAFGQSWAWIVVANVLLGISQGLTSSTAVIMKMDLGGPRQRGLAMGFNEAAGYLGVAVTGLGTGYLAATYGLRPAPLLLGAASDRWVRKWFITAGMLVNHYRSHSAPC
ncbi:hypothetical protein AR689_14570 [Arthrobacter sp. EpRS71]|nr:hypothetical protein AR689_14570 [Arthrobacter sp. EpRS71]